MAGCYTHLTIASKIIDNRVLESIGVGKAISKLLREWSNYALLGAVSPDLPYLGGSNKWADRFHYKRTSQIVREGLVTLSGKSFDDVDTQKQIAWLFGYVTHLVTDLYIHPVIEKKVGPYAENATEHRICEMNQDVWIVKKEMFNDVGRCEMFDNTIKTCTEDGVEGYFVDDVVSKFWKLLIKKVYSPWWSPSPWRWYCCFVTLMDKFAENPDKHLIITRKALKNYYYGYPPEPNMDYVENLRRPNGGSVDFYTVFNEAVEKVKEFWTQMAKALSTEDVSCFTLPDGDLDTGKLLSDPETSIFWG